MAVAGQRMLGRWGSSGTVDVGSMFKDMEVSINGWYPKMMVYNGKSQSKMDDLGVPPIYGNHHMFKHIPICPFFEGKGFVKEYASIFSDLWGLMNCIDVLMNCSGIRSGLIPSSHLGMSLLQWIFCQHLSIEMYQT